MKTFHLFLGGFLTMFIVSCNNEKKESKMNEIYKNEGLGQIEKYDFERTKGGKKRISYLRDNWLIDVGILIKGEGARQYEFAPAKDCYMIRKYYHPNGMIKERGKDMLNVRFGKWEYFDSKGNLINVIDEDAKFEDVEISREDVLQILEKEGWFNRATGQYDSLGKDLDTTGIFYNQLSSGNINMLFDSAVTINGKEIEPPKWSVFIDSWGTIDGMNFGSITYRYEINGHTGEFTKTYTFRQKEI